MAYIKTTFSVFNGLSIQDLIRSRENSQETSIIWGNSKLKLLAAVPLLKLQQHAEADREPLAN